VPEQSAAIMRVAVIAGGMHRISTAIPPSVVCAGFTFNQLLVDHEPLLFTPVRASCSP
tara:strand:- start:1059 stop:1232 length:174 start_codon:yes stop_codon:yes gene_type:complete